MTTEAAAFMYLLLGVEETNNGELAPPGGVLPRGKRGKGPKETLMRSLLLTTLVALSACAPPPTAFTADDEAAVRALEEAYCTGWLSNDSAVVMATLAPGAVLMPAGVPPLVGDSAIRRYWWPGDGSVTTIDSCEIQVAEVEGSGDMAYLRGTGSLAFTYQDAEGEVSQLTSYAVHLSVAERADDGRWWITRRSWSAIR
jgi:ketosteroid isomerase-like protein